MPQFPFNFASVQWRRQLLGNGRNCKCHGLPDLKTAITLLHISSIREYSVSHRFLEQRASKIATSRTPFALLRPRCKISPTISRLSGLTRYRQPCSLSISILPPFIIRARSRINFLRAPLMSLAARSLRHRASFPDGLAGLTGEPVKY